MTDTASLINKIVSLDLKPGHGYEAVGDRVEPVIAMYVSMHTDDERRRFRQALEQMLVDPRERVRDFAMAICLGLVMYRSAF